MKTFIEAWNSGAFGLEYHCLAPAMTGGIAEADYVARRLEARGDDDHEQRLTKVHTMTADSESAHVVIEREDTVRGFPKKRSENTSSPAASGTGRSRWSAPTGTEGP